MPLLIVEPRPAPCLGPSRHVAEDGREGVSRRHAAVHARDHIVEAGQHLVGIVERPVLEDVGLEPGFWELRGYHIYEDPWREQRFSGD